MTIGSAPGMQDLYLEILRRSQCNNLDGQRVYDSLLAHRDLWLAAYPVRESGGEDVTLRDLATDDHSVDTLLLRAKPEHEAALFELGHEWRADEIDSTRDQYGVTERLVTIRLWWD